MPESNRARARRWTFFCMAALAITLFALWNVSRRAMHMQTAAAANSGQELAAPAPGEPLKAVLQLTAVRNGSADGVVLERQSENAYRKTSKVMRVSIPADVSVVMGSAADIRKDAVVHMTGTVGPDKTLQATRVVILTGYVSVN
jgi:hypothetical protein